METEIARDALAVALRCIRIDPVDIAGDMGGNVKLRLAPVDAACLAAWLTAHSRVEPVAGSALED